MMWGLFILELSTLMFAFSENYWLLCCARFLEGASSAMTWTAAMALISDYYANDEQGVVYGNVIAGVGVSISFLYLYLHLYLYLYLYLDLYRSLALDLIIDIDKGKRY